MKKIKNSLSLLICIALCSIFTTLSFPGITVSAKPHTFEFDDNDYTLDVGDTATITRDGIKMTIQFQDEGPFFRIIKCEKLIKSARPKNYDGFCLLDNSFFSKYPCMQILDIKDKAFYKSKINRVFFNGEITDRYKSKRVFGVKSFAECKKLKHLTNVNAYTIFKKESFANCSNLKTITFDYACSFEKNSFKKVKAEITYNNVLNPAITKNSDKKYPKSLSAIKKDLKKAGFKKGTIVKVYYGKYNKRGVMQFKTFKL